MQSPQVSSLYVHFPFCETKCHYCDFYSLGRERTKAGDAVQFEAALRQEAELCREALAPELETLFWGGGTPSMTDPERMAWALEPLGLLDRVTPQTEWTMEANPSSVTRERLEQYRALGVNRISMGVQAIRDDHLKLLGRVHDRNQAFAALDAILQAGFTNVSVDLLCGVPGQTVQDIEDAVDTFLKYPVTHLSCYLLTLTPTHKMFSSLPHEEEQLRHLLFLDQLMHDRGFEHYEISNFARPGKRAQHNLRYWTHQSYLGLGPSAHSFDATQRTRWKNVSSLHQYGTQLSAGTLPREQFERLTDVQWELERWMLALRLEEGVEREWISTARQKINAEMLQNQGLLEAHPTLPGRLRLTARGFALSDQVVGLLIPE